jgi:hypothetical protein
MSNTPIPPKIKNQLLVKSAGRCQFKGCNQSLSKDLITKRDFNKAYIAHIVGDKSTGPRGDVIQSPILANALSNLMLLCDGCHRRVDAENGIHFSVLELMAMKKEHEERMERVTAIAPNMDSHIVIYKANVGQHSPFVSYEAMANYLLPKHYPAQSSSIDLGLTDSPFRDKDAHFWETEIKVLEENYNTRLRDLLRQQRIKHISLFAFAPMPLLIKLGTLINEIQNIEIHQPIRNPQTWNLSDDTEITNYNISEPAIFHPIVVLNISLSATISNDRITSVLGNECAIYTITIDNPNPNYLQNKIQLQDFKTTIQQLFNTIKAKYNAQTPIHIFPTMPIATAIELGRVWFPKADMPLYLYDENTANIGFVKVIEIVNS